jgi:hypothetical protein
MEQLKTPALIGFYGKKFTGKSHLLKYIIRALCTTGRFDYGFVISTTAFNGAYDWMPEGYVLDHFMEDFVIRLLAYQKANSEKKAFLVLDDCIGSVKFNSPIWDKLAISGRHYRLTIMYTTQRPVKIPPVMRENSEYVFLLKTQDIASRECLWKQYAGGIPKAQFFKIMDKSTQDYGAIMIDNQSQSNKATDMLKRVRAPATIKPFKLEFK